LVARFVRDEEVAGSNPVTPTRAEHCACRPSADCTSAPRSVFWGATPRPPVWAIARKAGGSPPGLQFSSWDDAHSLRGFAAELRFVAARWASADSQGLAVPHVDTPDLLFRVPYDSRVPYTALIARVTLRLSVRVMIAKTFIIAKEIRAMRAKSLRDKKYFRDHGLKLDGRLTPVGTRVHTGIVSLLGSSIDLRCLPYGPSRVCAWAEPDARVLTYPGALFGGRGKGA
jgi:hypothetical protein